MWRNALNFKRNVLNSSPTPLVHIYSHPRSGTHFLEAFLAKNFYPDLDLRVHEPMWGHWSNRKTNIKGTEYGKLFGSHRFPSNKTVDYGPAIYIYRDVRAVAVSCWKTPNFKHASWDKLSFSEYLRRPLDWRGSPGNPTTESSPSLTIVQHWYAHLEAWKDREDIYFVRYEDLINQPEKTARQISEEFRFLKMPRLIDPITSPTGLLPNAAKSDGWKNYFISSEDIDYVYSLVPKDYWGLYFD